MAEQVVQPLEAVKVRAGEYRIEDNGVRMMLFIGTNKALLVDTGFGNAGSVKAAVESLTDKPVMLVNTHADGDHIGRNDEFDMAYMHPAEIANYHQSTSKGAPVTALWEGERIDIGGRVFEVVLIPGHTPGCIALLDRENRIIISGDSISAGPVFMFGEGRSVTAYIASMEKLAQMAQRGEFDTIYPAHGPFVVSSAQIEKAIIAGQKLLAGELSPEEPPFPIPAKMYMHDGAGFFYCE